MSQYRAAFFRYPFAVVSMFLIHSTMVMAATLALTGGDVGKITDKVIELQVPQVGYTVYMRYPFAMANGGDYVVKSVSRTFDQFDWLELNFAAQTMGDINLCARKGRVEQRANQATVTCTGRAATKTLKSLTTFIQKVDRDGYLAGVTGTSSDFASLNNGVENTNTLLGQVGITNVNCFTGFWHDTCRIDYVRDGK